MESKIQSSTNKCTFLHCQSNVWWLLSASENCQVQLIDGNEKHICRWRFEFLSLKGAGKATSWPKKKSIFLLTTWPSNAGPIRSLFITSHTHIEINLGSYMTFIHLQNQTSCNMRIFVECNCVQRASKSDVEGVTMGYTADTSKSN